MIHCPWTAFQTALLVVLFQNTTSQNSFWYIRFYSRPVLAFGYCRCLRLCVCVCLSVCQSRVCPRDNSSPVQARITKFGAQMQNTLVKVPIVLWGDRLWPSRSNLTWKSNFTSFWAYPDSNLSSVQARVTKFRPKMHLSTVKIPID